MPTIINTVLYAIGGANAPGFRCYDYDNVADHYHLYWIASAEL